MKKPIAALCLALLPRGLALAAGESDDSDFLSGSCQFVHESLTGPVLRVKDYVPPLETNCATYERKIVVWDTTEKERYFGYVTPDTVCTLNGDPTECDRIKVNDEVVTNFERKVSSETRGKLLEVHATRR
jgi:hypothetical protein